MSTFETLGLVRIAMCYIDGAARCVIAGLTRLCQASRIQRGRVQREGGDLPSLFNRQREDVYAE